MPDSLLRAVGDQLSGPLIVQLGPDIDATTEALLTARGVETTRSSSSALVTVTGDAAAVPAGTRWVHTPSMGVDRLLAPGWDSTRLLTRTVGDMPRRIASYTSAVLMAERWQLARYVRDQAGGRWAPAMDPAPLAPERCLVIGVGEVGQAIAHRLVREGHDVTGTSLSGRPVQGVPTVVPFADLPKHLDVSVLVIALPSTSSTEAIIDDSFIGRLVGAHLVNVGRGATVDADAVLRGLDTGHLRHATLDVLSQEPPPHASPLWSHPRVVITPHIAGRTAPLDTVTSLMGAWVALRDGNRPSTLVDPVLGY
ncbi:NAD(P)-dependent oxidoreductase [Cellulomonas sp. P22]|uniref:NAD(P)-dependent oxidoreductase n=1 Tax=Cellulomonas sp. P22 TaxID=3373189 RepID=UPI0037BC2E4C